ncbi:MAG TPA: hypothetical protein VFD04_17975 [Actinomycetes bacterium]|nr:hypothetical protein [Actinomycetes bacterium]
MSRLFMLSMPAKVNVAGMLVAAAGILVEYFSGVEGFPTVPPGPFILAGAAALVAFGPWRWTPAVAVLAPLLSLALGTLSTVLNWGTTAPLSDPGEPAGFAGAVLQFSGLLAALAAGIVVVMRPPQVRA